MIVAVDLARMMLTSADQVLGVVPLPAVQIGGHAVLVATLDMRWVLPALGVTIVGFFLIGALTFRKQVIN